MNQIEEIMADYEDADEEQRLSMFLTHRDLRQDFTAIDMAGMTGKKKTVAKGIKQVDDNRRSFAMACTCWGWLKQCCSVR